MDSKFAEHRKHSFKPVVPTCAQNLKEIVFEIGDKTESKGHTDRISKLFPSTYGQPIINMIQNKESVSQNNDLTQKLKSKTISMGVMYAGGPAPGGHNVITGLFDTLKELHPENKLVGFLGGPGSVVTNKFTLLTNEIIDNYRNTGGFSMIGTGRYKTLPKVHFPKIFENLVFKHKLDGFVIIGGEGTNTMCCMMAEYFGQRFESMGERAMTTLRIKKCNIIGVPKTIDGDLQNDYIEISFGFDTAVRTYSQLISNICRQCITKSDTWHFIKLMGRAASHVTLECSLQCHPNITLICEQIESYKRLLEDICEEITNVICDRSNKKNKNYGVILIPEGIIGFIPSMTQLVNDLDYLLRTEEALITGRDSDAKIKTVKDIFQKQGKLTELSNFCILPYEMQKTLLLERDASGHVQMSQIPIETLFMHIVSKKLEQRRERGLYKGEFKSVSHFFGYEGRCAWPTNFDCNYCYNLGRASALLANQGYNGYMARVFELEKLPIDWKLGGIPITMLLNMKNNYDNIYESRRDDMSNAHIEKALLDLDGNKFRYFSKQSKIQNWALNDCYRFIAPIQYFTNNLDIRLTDSPPMNVLLKKTNCIEWNVNVNYNNSNSFQSKNTNNSSNNKSDLKGTELGSKAISEINNSDTKSIFKPMASAGNEDNNENDTNALNLNSNQSNNNSKSTDIDNVSESITDKDNAIEHLNMRKLSISNEPQEISIEDFACVDD